ncbi:MAG: PAS domain S-box protein [Ferruginibacter sp.]
MKAIPLQTILKNAPFGYAFHEIITDHEGVPVDYRFLEVNQAFENLTGLNAINITGKKASDCFPEIKDSAFDWILFYGNIALEGQAKTIEQYSAHNDCWYKVQVFAPEHGYFCTVFTDISAEKEKNRTTKINQQNIIKNEQLLRNITDNITDIVFTADFNFNLTYISPSIVKLTGDTPETILAKPFEQIHSHATFLKFKQILEEELLAEADAQSDKNRTRIIEAEMFDIYGNIIPVAEHIAFLRDEKGIPIGVIGVTRNITEQKQTESNLIFQKKYNDSILSAIPDLLIILNAQGTILEVKDGTNLNAKIQSLFNSKDNINDVFAPELVAQFKRNIDALLQDDEINAIEFSLQLDNELNYFEARLSLFEKDKIIVLVRNISKQKQAEIALKNNQEKYKRLIEKSPNIIYGYSPLEGKSYHSPKVYDILGYTHEQLAAHPSLWTDSIHPDDIIYVKQAVAAAQKGQHINLQYRIKTAGGEWRWLEDVSINMLNEGDDFQIEGIATDITERKIAEEKIRKFTQAVEQSPATIVITNLKGEIEYVNPKFTELTGYTVEEAIGQNPKILKSGETSSKEYDSLWTTICSGKEWHGEFHNRKKNGELFWEIASISPIKDEEGKITHFLAVKEDVTSRKIVEATLRENEQRLDQLATHGRTISWEVDKHGRYTFISHVVEKILGYHPDEIIGKMYFYDFHPEFGRETFKTQAFEVFKSKAEFRDLPNMAITKQGKTIWLSTNGIPMLSADGSLIGYRGSDSDITERKLAAEALLESEERFRSLFQENASAMFIIKPDDGKIVDANPACIHFYGWSKDDFLKMNIQDLTISIDDFHKKFEKIKSEKSHRFEFIHKKADGSSVYTEIFSSLITISGVKLIHAIVHDITDRVQYFEAVETQNKILKDIAWTQSHLVRAPLARIMGLVPLLDNDKVINTDSQNIIKDKADLAEAVLVSANELDQIIRTISEKTQVVKEIAHKYDEISKWKMKQVNINELEILLVDDDRIILMLHQVIIAQNRNQIKPQTFQHGQLAINHIRKNDNSETAFLILLDINMPEMTGWEFLDELQKCNFNSPILVAMLTSSVDPGDQARAEAYPEVIAFYSKPITNETVNTLKQHIKLKSIWD